MASTDNSSGSVPWWIVYEQGPIRGPNPGGKTFYAIFRAATSEDAKQKDINKGGTPESVDGPYDTQADAQKAADGVVQKNKKAAHKAENKSFPSPPNPFSWLSSETGGIMASAIESGTDNIFRDLWRAIAPWVILPAGVALIILGFVLFFRNQIGELAGVAAQVAMMVAK